MEKTYVASLTARFYGQYYSIRYLDFDDLRGPDVEPEDLKNIDLMQQNLQKIVDEMVAKGEKIPEPKLKSYDNVRLWGSINSLTYVSLTVRVP